MYIYFLSQFWQISKYVSLPTLIHLSFLHIKGYFLSGLNMKRPYFRSINRERTGDSTNRGLVKPFSTWVNEIAAKQQLKLVVSNNLSMRTISITSLLDLRFRERREAILHRIGDRQRRSKRNGPNSSLPPPLLCPENTPTTPMVCLKYFTIFNQNIDLQFYLPESYPTSYPHENLPEGGMACHRPSTLYPSATPGSKQQPTLTTSSGSATCSSENSSPPACLRWAHSLHMLLQDPDGVKLFQRYLNCEGKPHADAMDFWFACEGLRKEIASEKIHLLVKVIYKWVFSQYFL